MLIAEMSMMILRLRKFTTHSVVYGKDGEPNRVCKTQKELLCYFQTTEGVIAINPIHDTHSVLSSKSSENTPLMVSFLLHFTKNIYRLFVCKSLHLFHHLALLRSCVGHSKAGSGPLFIGGPCGTTPLLFSSTPLQPD